MEINVVQVIPYSRELVFRTIRDQLPELGAYLPNIESIQVEQREEPAPGEVKLLNRWKAAKTEVPAVARAFLDPAKLAWLDRAHWQEADWSNTWDIEVSFMKERVSCRGRSVYTAKDARSTEVRILGELALDLKGLLPGFLASRAAPSVESFVVGLIQPNFAKVNDGVAKYLEAHPELLG
ncbi:MAG: hypothetical protein RBU45_16205 [Myxococcota bacterium]|jgi:hypothetical protein|nr:hypothetical protein [Myxococcota bacterium]